MEPKDGGRSKDQDVAPHSPPDPTEAAKAVLKVRALLLFSPQP